MVGTSPTSAAARCTSTTSPRERPSTLAAPDGPRGRATGSPTSSRPRRWSGCAATGGRPRATHWSSRASTTHPVQRWHIADPAHPDRSPTVVAYPAAGTPNALVSAESSRLDGRRTPIRWTEEYLADVVWDDHGLLVVVQPRDQTALRALRVDPATGATALDHERTDPVWVDIVPGVPAHTAAGALVTVADAEGARRLVVDGDPVTPPSLQVRERAGRRRRDRAAPGERDPGVGRAVDVGARTGSSARTPADGVHTGRLRGGTLAGRPPGPHRSTATVTTVERARVGHHDRVARRAVRPGSPGHAAPRGRPPPADRAAAAVLATSPAPGCRCSWTPTAARTPSASSPRATRT